jgi:hypothetical protein
MIISEEFGKTTRLSRTIRASTSAVALFVCALVGLPASGRASGPELLDPAQLDAITAGLPSASAARIDVSAQASGTKTRTTTSADTSAHQNGRVKGTGTARSIGTDGTAVQGAGEVVAGTASAWVEGAAGTDGPSTSNAVVRLSGTDGPVVDTAQAVITTSADGQNANTTTSGGGTYTGDTGKVFTTTRNLSNVSITRVIVSTSSPGASRCGIS